MIQPNANYLAASAPPAYSFTQLEALWVEAGGSQAMAPFMAAIAGAESSFGTNLHGDFNSKTGQYESFGLWQINTPAHPQFDAQRLVTDPLYNAEAAVAVFKSQGINAWTTAWSNDGGKTRVPFGQSSAGQILSQLGSSSAFGTPGTVGSQIMGGGQTVGSDWSPAVKIMVVSIALLLIIFAAAGAHGASKESPTE